MHDFLSVTQARLSFDTAMQIADQKGVCIITSGDEPRYALVRIRYHPPEDHPDVTVHEDMFVHPADPA